MVPQRLSRRVGALFALLLAVLPAVPAAAFLNNAGGSTAEFLRVGVGARASGMGEAYGPVAEGPDAIYWNPAGLARLEAPEISYSHIEMLGFFHHDTVAYAHPVRLLRGTLGVSGTLWYQDTLDLVTNRNETVGAFRPHSEVVTLAYATAFGVGEDFMANDREFYQDLWYHPQGFKPLDRTNELWTGNLALGLGVKMIQETIFDARALAAAVDGGVHFRHSEVKPLSLSFVFRNVGSKAKFVNESESLPVEIAFGAAYDASWRERRLLTAVEAVVPYYGDPYGKLGVEYSFSMRGERWAAVRIGYKSLSATDLGPLTGVTGGIGFGAKRLAVDFSFQPMDELGATFRGSVGWRF
jgi:hypothetical protein